MQLSTLIKKLDVYVVRMYCGDRLNMHSMVY